MKTDRAAFTLGAVALVAMSSGHAQEGAAIVENCRNNIGEMISRMEAGAVSGPFRPEWDSLKKHNAQPEWFQDGKIGIYFHWGVYSVPAYGNEWYARRMHLPEGRKRDRRYYQHHVAEHGEPDEFGYHDFVPMFKAEHFDAREWADLFIKAGAKWAGPVCEHHDGFSMWDSDLTPWNAGDMGPKRDITGELAEAIKGRGMKFVTTFHHERTRNWYPRVDGWPTTSDDPVLQFMYMNIEEELFYKIFQAKLGEVIDKYQPDLVWFDGQMTQIPDPYHRYFLAYYFNSAARWNREVMVTTKKLQYPQEVSVLDYEKGLSKELTPYPWLNDDTISTGSWCYTESLEVKSPETVLHTFIDAVSKNGQLLLNISPRSDGIIPQVQRDCLLEIGKWLEMNGEAIYNTRPWLQFGEGPTRLKRAGSHQGALKYKPEDIRYTRSKDGKALYAIVLGWPENGTLSPEIVQLEQSDDSTVELLGHEGVLDYKLADKRIAVELPEERPCRYASAFKLTGFRTSLTPAVAKARRAALEELSEGPIDPGKAH